MYNFSNISVWCGPLSGLTKLFKICTDFFKPGEGPHQTKMSLRLYNTIPDETELIMNCLIPLYSVLQPYAVTCSKYWWPELAPTNMFPFAIIMQESWQINPPALANILWRVLLSNLCTTKILRIQNCMTVHEELVWGKLQNGCSQFTVICQKVRSRLWLQHVSNRNPCGWSYNEKNGIVTYNKWVVCDHHTKAILVNWHNAVKYMSCTRIHTPHACLTAIWGFLKASEAPNHGDGITGRF